MHTNIEATIKYLISGAGGTLQITYDNGAWYLTIVEELGVDPESGYEDYRVIVDVEGSSLEEVLFKAQELVGEK